MKLITAKPSPFGRKVRVLLSETDQLKDVKIHDVMTTPVATDPDLAAANPVGKIPALVRPDAATLYDSRVICRFLDDRAGAGLYPETRLWEVLTLEATADGILDAAVLMVYEHRVRPEEIVYDKWIDAQWDKVMRSVGAINARWMSQLAGRMDMSHIAVGCALGYLDFRHGARNWRTGHDDLAMWFADFDQRDSMQQSKPE